MIGWEKKKNSGPFWTNRLTKFNIKKILDFLTQSSNSEWMKELNKYKLSVIKSLFSDYKCVFLNGNNYSANMLSNKVEIHDVVELTLIDRNINLKNEKIELSTDLLFQNQLNDPQGSRTLTRLV